jgi:hypothetical protein
MTCWNLLSKYGNFKKKNLKIWQLRRVILHIKSQGFPIRPFLLLQDWPSLPFCGWHILRESPCSLLQLNCIPSFNTKERVVDGRFCQVRTLEVSPNGLA